MLWTGQPQRKVIFRKDWNDWYVILIGLFWNGALLSNGYHNWSKWGIWARRGIFVPMLVFAAFFVFGQYLLWGRLAYTAWRKGRTHYAVTTKRVMVLNAGSTRKITDMYFAKLDSVSLSVRADGIGTIEFSPGPRRTASWLRNPGWADIDLSMLTFYDIENAQNVYQLIEDQRQQSLKWTPPSPHAVLSVGRHFDGTAGNRRCTRNSARRSLAARLPGNPLAALLATLNSPNMGN